MKLAARFMSVVLVLFVAAMAQAQDQPDLVACYSGVSLWTGPNGASLGQGNVMTQRTYDPTNNQILYHVVYWNLPTFPNIEESTTTITVEGSLITGIVADTPMTGTGELIGEPWHWTSMRMDLALPDGTRATSQEDDTPDGRHVLEQIFDASGNVMMAFDETMTSMDCQAWEEQRQAVLAGETVTAPGTGDGTGEDVDVAAALQQAYPNVVLEEVEYEANGRMVHGALTRPAAEGVYPALFILAGSGPTDRDWNSAYISGTNGSARLLAFMLSDAGIVVLRIDKLGVGETSIPPEIMSGTILTPEHMLADQRAGIRYLQGLPMVDTARIFLAGHSEGGTYALRLAEEPDLGIRGLLLLSTTGRPQGEVVTWQVCQQVTAEECASFTTAIQAIGAGQDVNPTEVTTLEGIQQLLAAYLVPAARPLANWLLTYSPISAFEHVSMPILIVQGGKDQQVNAELDAQPIYTAAQEAGLTDVEFFLAPNADHVLKLEETPVEQLTPLNTLAYNAAERVLDPDVVSTILRWLQAH